MAVRVCGDIELECQTQYRSVYISPIPLLVFFVEMGEKIEGRTISRGRSGCGTDSNVSQSCAATKTQTPRQSTHYSERWLRIPFRAQTNQRSQTFLEKTDSMVGNNE